MKLDKYYTSLSSEERLKLIINALSRDDDQEYNLLTESAPFKEYRIRDPKVGDKLDASREIILLFLLTFLDCAHRLELIESKKQFTTVLLQDKSGDDQENLEFILKELDGLFEDGLKQLNATYEGFSNFCKSIEIELDTFLSSYNSHGIKELEKFKKWLSCDTMDDKLRELTEQRFMDIWEKRS